MLVSGQSLTKIAKKIRSRTGNSVQLQFPTDFISEVNSLAGDGKTVVTGTWSANGDTLFEKKNLGFEPEGAVLMLYGYSGSTSTDKVSCAIYPAIDGGGGKHGQTNHLNNIVDQGFGFDVKSANNWTISLNADWGSSPPVFQGTYLYVIWG